MTCGNAGYSNGREGGGSPGEGAVELAARTDGELGEDLAQVVLDRADAEEQPGTDLGVGQGRRRPAARPER